MNITVNGKAKEIKEALTLANLLTQLEYDATGVAVALNEEFVPRGRYPDITLKDDDALEVVAPRQGG